MGAIAKFLSTAVKLYLRSQVSQVEQLQVKIVGKDGQILKGYIPQVFLSCQRGVYQGLYLREVEVNGTNIAFNLPEVLKKKPLQLLEPIAVAINFCLNAKDLESSLDSALLQSGLSDLWQIILSTPRVTPLSSELASSSVEWKNIAISEQQLILSGIYQDDLGRNNQINLSTAITLANDRTLRLSALKIADKSSLYESIEELEIDLGTDVKIEQLIVKSEQILCSGKIIINN
ncbi:MAG: DUF2993 domain-containing protein [Pleurocapsa sp. MO_226.B13]|nr:DUF2993 domain-containing protein [Pleurocapsa sp. MO_226.B13]